MNPIVVWKIGGSLLDWPLFPARLEAELAARKSSRLVLVVGGGGAVEWVREIDRLHSLGEERGHELALEALEVTARFVCMVIRNCRTVDGLDAMETAWQKDCIPIVLPKSFLADDAAVSTDPLAHTWEVTSDSIAARVAERLQARELVLFKSIDYVVSATLEEAAALGLVDCAFPQSAKRMARIVFANLRSGPPIQTWSIKNT